MWGRTCRNATLGKHEVDENSQQACSSETISMEPFAKRQRIHGPIDINNIGLRWSQQISPFESDLEEDELNAGVPIAGVFKTVEASIDAELDPDEELEMKRQYVQQKTRSAFEAIFEKYGKSFDGIGDEVDLRTGKILVDNGHLMKMEDERDAGDDGFIGTLQGSDGSNEHEDQMENVAMSDVADSIADDFNEDAANHSVDESMVEDDIILRGLNPKALQTESANKPRLSAEEGVEGRYKSTSVVRQDSVLPSESQILAQFGPQLGPQIVDYVAKRREVGGEQIEQTWRAPSMPVFSIGQRPVPESVKQYMDARRSLSPQGAPSLWAPTQRRASIATLASEADSFTFCRKTSNVTKVVPSCSIDRPARVRKPAQKDSTIIGWSQAVEIIEHFDPKEYAELLADVKGTEFLAERQAHPVNRSVILPSSIPDSQDSQPCLSSSLDTRCSNVVRKVCSADNLALEAPSASSKVRKQAFKKSIRRRRSLPAPLTHKSSKSESTATNHCNSARIQKRTDPMGMISMGMISMGMMLMSSVLAQLMSSSCSVVQYPVGSERSKPTQTRLQMTWENRREQYRGRKTRSRGKISRTKKSSMNSAMNAHCLSAHCHLQGSQRLMNIEFPSKKINL